MSRMKWRIKAPWKVRTTFVAMTGDEVWLVVKFQTNLEIAGSPEIVLD